MEMTTKAPEGMEQLLPAFHGQSAQILAYVAAMGSATPEEMRKDLGMPRSTIYKLLSQLVRTGLAVRGKAGKVDEVRVPDFVFFIKNTALVGECKVTPRNVLAFDSAHTPAGRMFADRHGLQKFAKFVMLMVTNQNPSIIPQAITYGAVTYPAPSPTDRPLLTCATLSYHNNVANRNGNVYVGIDGGWSKPHRTAHLNGTIPSGGNIGMLDGSGRWVKFPAMIPRTLAYPYFWW